MVQNDIALILAFQEGKYHAFETLYERYFQKVYTYLFYKTGKEETAQDICSETFLSAFEHLKDFKTEKGGNFGGRLLSIAHHKYVDWIRKNKEEALSLNEEIISEEKESLLDKVDISIQAEQILSFLETLGEEKKEIVILRLRDQLNYDEIAVLLDKTPESCRKLFSRTMESLCDVFWK